MGTVSQLPPGKRKPPAKTEDQQTLLTPEDRFVREYLIDRDPLAAGLRAGVSSLVLEKKVKKWMQDPEIVKRIQQETDNQDIATMITPQRIMAGFLDVAFDRSAPHAARNSALRELAEFAKMYPKEDDGKEKPKNNVMIVPATPALKDWTAAAMTQQKSLKDEVKE